MRGIQKYKSQEGKNVKFLSGLNNNTMDRSWAHLKTNNYF